MGLKCDWYSIFPFIQQIKIRPLWDWNNQMSITQKNIDHIKIRPLWDWNYTFSEKK